MRYNFFIIFFIIICHNIFSQGIKTNIVQRNLALDYRIRDFVVHAKRENINYGEKYIGTFFLFDDWKNNCKIQLNGKKITLNNVNFNVQNNEFMSEIGKDSVFAITPKYIDFISINDKIYKYHFYKEENKFFEVLLDDENKFSILKGYFIKILPKSEIGMANRPFDEIRKEEKIYILKGSKFIRLKLKKKDIIKNIDKDKQSMVHKYVKENKLSYKKERDVVRIFKYYHTI